MSPHLPGGPTVLVVGLAGLAALALASAVEMVLVGLDPAPARPRGPEATPPARPARAAELLLACQALAGLGTAALAASATLLLADAPGDLPPWGAALLAWPLAFLLAEAVPRALGLQLAGPLAPVLVPALVLLSPLLAPPLALLRRLGRQVGAARPLDLLRQELVLWLEGGPGAPPPTAGVDPVLLRRVFQFTEAVVEDAMVPLIEVVAVPASTPVVEVARRMAATGHSRLPVYRERVDRIVGVVLHPDLLAAPDWGAPVEAIARPPLFVPETKPVGELLLTMRRARAHMAVVVDEYGGAVGLITTEDLLEEIVGDIEDESDRGADLVRRTGDREWVVHGRVEHHQLEQACGLRLPDGDYETLAGYLLDELGRVPRPGEHVVLGEWILTVGKASDRAVLEVWVRRRA